MAKKKRTTKRASTRAKGKKTASKKRSTKTPGKSTVRNSSSKRPALGSRNNSVDLLLKRFAQERTDKESQLASLRKNKQELEEKARKFHEQIAKLAQQEKEIQTQITLLDKQRNNEVGELLSKLGIQLGDGPAVTAAETRETIAQPSEVRMKHPRERGAVSTSIGRNENN